MPIQVRARRVRDRFTVEQGPPDLSPALSVASARPPLVLAGAFVTAVYADASGVALPPTVSTTAPPTGSVFGGNFGGNF